MKSGKSVLITGSTRGLGKALAEEFAINGYSLILHGKESLPPELKLDFSYENKEDKKRYDFVSGDLRLDETIMNLVEVATRKDIDVFINNAAVYINKPFEKMDYYLEYKKILDINLIAPIILTGRLWPIFEKKKSGIIININSLAGKTGSEGESAYAASKHGLKGFFDSIQFDATRSGIQIINVYLGAMKTLMSQHKKHYEKFIDVKDAASIIFDVTKSRRTSRVTEIMINRREY